MEKLDALATSSPLETDPADVEPLVLSNLSWQHPQVTGSTSVTPKAAVESSEDKRTNVLSPQIPSHGVEALSNCAAVFQERTSPLTVAARFAESQSAGWDESTLRGDGPSVTAGSVHWSPFGGTGGMDDVCRSGLEEESSLSPFSSPAGGGNKQGSSEATLNGEPIPSRDRQDRGGRTRDMTWSLGPDTPGDASGSGQGTVITPEAGHMTKAVAQLPVPVDPAGRHSTPTYCDTRIIRGAGSAEGVEFFRMDSSNLIAATGGSMGGVNNAFSGASDSSGNSVYSLELHVAAVAVGRLELRYGDALCVDCVAPLPAPAGDLIGDALQSQVTLPVPLRD